jgi:hypothetical protein
MGNCFHNDKNDKTDNNVIIKAHKIKMSTSYTINYPEHKKRQNTSLYNKTHKDLCNKLSCFICNKTSNDTSLETHHFYCKKAGTNGIDWIKFGQFAQTCYNIQTGILIGDKFNWNEVAKNPDIFVDSQHNMIVLCLEHHRSGNKGIHHVPFPDWILQKNAKKNFQFLI